MSTVDNKVTDSWWLRLNYTVTNYPDRIVISANGGPYSNSMNVSSSLKMSATCRLMLDDQSTSGTITFYTITSGTYKSAISGSKTIYKGHEEYWIEAEVTCTEASDASGNITGLYKLAGYSSNVYLGVLPKDNWTVSFNANGGSNSPNSQTKWYNENLTLSTSKPSRTGYSFIKWNTKADGTGTDYNPGASYTANADLTLYAVWYPTVTYNANGGSGAPAQAVKTPGTPIAISTTQPTRAGYTFSKWNTSADGTGTDYSPGASYSTDAPLVLYAQWTPNTYQVSFDANTGKHAPSAINRTYGQPVTLPSTVPVKMAADFVGWATNSSGTGTLYQPGGSYNSSVAAAEILYAVWRSTYTDPAFAIDVVRTDDHGDEEDDGDHALITVLWSINPLIEPDTGESTNTATLECYMSYVNSQGQTVRTEVELEDAGEENELQGTKTSGEARALVSNIDTDTRYTIEVTVVDSRGTSVTKTEILSMAFFTMDFLAGGHGVGIGKAATREMLDVGMQAQFDKSIKIAETDVPPTFYYQTKPSESNLPVKPCIVIQTSDWSVWYCDDEETPAYHKLSDQNNLKKTDNYLAEVRLTNVDFYSWVTTAANVHTTGTADQLTQARFYADSYASYNLPCVDSHISVYSINGSDDTRWLRCVALDIRTNNVYVNCRNTGTWTGWVQLSPNGHTHSYLPLSGGTMTGSLIGTTHGSSWISQVTAAVPIVITPAGVTDGGRYDAFIRGKFTDGSTWTFGVIEKAIDICYFAAGRTANGTDGRIKFDVVNGQVYAGGTALSKNGHTHSYLPLSGGTMVGTIYFGANSYISPDRSQNNCNSTSPAIYSYSTSSSNRPYNTGYGHIVNIGGNDSWKYQIAFPTYGNGLMWRCNINNDGWSAWRSSAEGHDGTRATAGTGTYNFLYTMNSGDRINYMSRGNDYLHIETANYGNKGVTWWSSDIRLKENIADSTVDALEVVNSIEHKSFDLNTDGKHHDIGYIAQQLEELDPQMVLRVFQTREVAGVNYFTGDYTYQIDERKVIPYLSRSIQQLSAENDELRAKNAELESRLERIEKELGL